MASYNDYYNRHVGPRGHNISDMLKEIGVKSVDELIDKTIPEDIKLKNELNIPGAISEYEYLNRIREISFKNKVFRSYIGMGYYGTITPSVIKRNILENPGWYTSYTPYQAEISQGRLEALLNYQTLITELTGLQMANSSLLDEATAAAEAMIMLHNARSRDAVKNGTSKFFIDKETFPQTIDVVKTRAKFLNIDIVIDSYKGINFTTEFFGALVQYPNNVGQINDYKKFSEEIHKNGGFLVVASDLAALVLLEAPGHWGADVVVGSTQRFGLPLGYGGPHAGFFATKDEFKRLVPGRIIGVSVDVKERKALRMALQTREQHIKREKATSNICTAQALLAIMSGMYSVYHGKEGLLRISKNIHSKTALLEEKLKELGFNNKNKIYFDTLLIELPENVNQKDVEIYALEEQINLRYFNNGFIGISVDETTGLKDINDIINIFAKTAGRKFEHLIKIEDIIKIPADLLRNDEILKQDVFNSYQTEPEMMRYIKSLENKDISLTHSMISLGSCTMKLNAATTLMPLSWPEFGNLHPFVPFNQTEGYQQLFYELEKDLKEITGFDSVSFQPNSGASGEYTGLIIIREYHNNIGQSNRDVVLIPASAHGTNPASAAMAGLKVVVVGCDIKGNINIDDLRLKAGENKENLSCLMVTYPSTHGVFEEDICEITKIIHSFGGQVYMDGANMNAQVGLTSPSKIGADVCHINLHKTFAIPHGGGGPGVGPVCVAKHLTEFLPGHDVIETGGVRNTGAVSAAPWGSASILTISYAYCKMLGKEGLVNVTKMAILNSNYLAARLKKYYKILYAGKNNTVAHEMIIDCRDFKNDAGIIEIDIAKRLMDYGFHAPTVSFPVHGTLMVEPTESESKKELDRFADAMISIYNEIQEIKEGKSDRENNVLKNAPHSYHTLIADTWSYGYSREKAAFPLPWICDNKYWPPVDRVNDAYGDRNLVCTCMY